MAANHMCPQCGSELWCDLSPEGLCPKCLLCLGLENDEDFSGPNEDPPPLSIGPYQVLKLLGEGGMGLVYLAEQKRPIRRKVAVKIIKMGMDTKRVIARFKSERQALALMSHPHIARVFDAGSTDQGRPYFVMEFVAGIPITEYCDKHRLSIRDRLLLFQQVCDAIQHAHNRGIIHRDIKPSNVLVERMDGKPMPKVIDFGVAKATSQRQAEKTFFNEHGILIGTPEYMSPEQTNLGDQDVDSQTDVYSLGVLLYELLAGAPPFDSGRLRRAGFDAMLKMIREEEPAILTDRLGSLGNSTWEIALSRNTDYSTLWKQLKGELDWITQKAINKVPAKRYSSASELASEIEKYLRRQPVSARPLGATFYIRKYLEQYKLAIRGFLAVLTLLTVIFLAKPVLFPPSAPVAEPLITHQAEPQIAGAGDQGGEPGELRSPTTGQLSKSTDLAVPLADREARLVFRSAENLSSEEAALLEKEVFRNPHDEISRTKLVGYYSREARKNPSAHRAMLRHIFWLIRNAPDSAVLGIADTTLLFQDADNYLKGKMAWIEQLKNRPRSLKVLEYSARYFMLRNPELAEQSLLKGRQLDRSDPKWPRNLGYLYSLTMRKDPSMAPKALQQLEIAFRMSSEMERSALLTALGKAAWAVGDLKKAREYAEWMIGTGSHYGANFHHGNIVLGLLALSDDDVEEAKSSLIAAGETTGGELSSFGPDMTLAKRLLERGEEEVVLQYFELCSEFWISDRGRLDEWAEDVEQGRMPDFRSNLRYD